MNVPTEGSFSFAEREAFLVHRLSRPGAGWRVRYLETCDSTMDEARGMLDNLLPAESALIVTESQSRGRGRQGRVWQSPESGFFATYVFQGTTDTHAVSSFTLAVGQIICEVLADKGYNLGLKWPNDILSLKGEKVSGVLAELVTRGKSLYLLIGIGINLAGEPDGGKTPTTSLFSLNGVRHVPVDIALSLSNSLLDGWRLFEKQGLAPFREKWLGRALFLGSRLTLNPGAGSVAGIFRGISPTGALLLETADAGTQEIVSAHIESIEPGNV